MRRGRTGRTTYEEAVHRMRKLYAEGHRVVVSFSGGKDSTVLLNVCVEAAEQEGRLPVEVVARDEEILYPGTYEFWRRTAKRSDVDFNWLVAHQPIVNVYNRKQPYFWVFDPWLDPDEWVRKPPEWATRIEDLHIEGMTTPERFPPAEGKKLVQTIGLRTAESRGRMYGIFSSKGYIAGGPHEGTIKARPIYDFSDGDVWKAILDHGWDYCEAYDTLSKLGLSKSELRIGPPTMTIHSVDVLAKASKAWPRWFEKVCERLPGVRAAAHYGRRAVTPRRKAGESWKDAYKRECIDNAPDWIAQRAHTAAKKATASHRKHSAAPFPEVQPCPSCPGANLASWKKLAYALYNGDPFCLKVGNMLPLIEPEFFRDGAGTWGGGTPSF